MLLFLFALVAFAAAQPRTLQQLQDTDRYVAEALLELPYAGLTEPIKVYYDGANSRSRTEYYHGQDIYLYLGNVGQYGTLKQIVPVHFDNRNNTSESCFETDGSKADGSIAPQSILPDLSQFKNLGASTYRGINVNRYSYEYNVGVKTNVYDFYTDVLTGLPVGFEMMGHDDLLGSHYDHYVIVFYTFDDKPAPFADELFMPPNNMTCGGFPGPGAAHASHRRGGLAVVSDPDMEHNHTDMLFAEHKRRFNKTYTDIKEHQQRRHNFMHNKRFVESTNRAGKSYKTALNHMADWHESEFKSLRGSYSSRSQTEYQYVAETRNAQLSAIDWRTKGYVTNVKDQAVCGSCWSFGAAESIEGQVMAKTGKLVPLSQQALMDCSWAQGNNACDGGEAFRAYEYILNHGIPTEASYGVYLGADGACHASDAGVEIGANLTGYVSVASGNMDAMLGNLSKHGPLAVAIDASLKSFNFYSSGVYYDEACGNTPDDLDHAVLAVGFGTDPTGGDYWIVKNSWSTYYGDDGYINMSRKNNNCGVATDAHLPLVQ